MIAQLREKQLAENSVRYCQRILSSALFSAVKYGYIPVSYTHLAGMKMEPFLRALVSGCTLRERPPDSYTDLASQVAAIGNNLNQLTRLANSTGKIENAQLAEANRMMQMCIRDRPIAIEFDKILSQQVVTASAHFPAV